jgi:hypothetical protein
MAGQPNSPLSSGLIRRNFRMRGCSPGMTETLPLGYDAPPIEKGSQT